MRKNWAFRWTVFTISLFFLSAFITAAHADYQTNLSYYGLIQDNLGDIDIDLYSVPVVYDWDSDGKKDLLVGQRYDDVDGSHGYVSFYQNTGTNAAPSFTSGTTIQACTNTCSLDVSAGG